MAAVKRKLGVGTKKVGRRVKVEGARKAILRVFEELGGIEGMVGWAREDPTRFYQSVFPRLLAAELKARAGQAGASVGQAWFRELLGKLDGGHKELVKARERGTAGERVAAGGAAE